MPAVATRLFLFAFLASLAVHWPALPFNAHLPDLLFVGVVLLLALERARPSAGRLHVFVALYLLGGVPSLLVTTDLRAGLIELARESYLAAVYLAIAAAVRIGYGSVIAAGMAWSGGSLAVLGVAYAAARALGAPDQPALAVAMPLPYVGSVSRLYALTATPSMLACLLTMSVPFAIGQARRHTPAARMWTILAVIMTAAAVLTFSHSIAGLAVAVTIALWPVLASRHWLKRLCVAGATALTIVFNTVASISVQRASAGGVSLADTTAHYYGVDGGHVDIGTLAVDYQIMGYLRLKQVALDAWTEHPIAGVGLDRFHDVTEAAFQRGALTESHRALDPHSTLPGRLAETGTIGGITLIALWIAFAQAGGAAFRSTAADAWIARAAAAGLAGLAISGINADVMNFRFVWVALALVCAIPAISDRRH